MLIENMLILYFGTKISLGMYISIFNNIELKLYEIRKVCVKYVFESLDS